MSNPSAAQDVACPFCSRPVNVELTLYGGRCPHCFGEIPGEESPTDPGEEKKKAAEIAAVKQASKKSVLPMVLIAGFLVVPVAIAGYLALAPKPKAPVNLDLEEYEFGDVGELVAYQQPAAAPGAGASTGAAPKSRGSALDALSQRKPLMAGDSSEIRIVDGAVAADPMAPRSPGVMPGGIADERPTIGLSSGAGASAGFEATTIDVQRREQTGVTLTDDDAIVDMVKAVVQVELPKLRTCYEHELKTKDTLAGTWTLEFTVTTSGKVARPKATGREMSDADLEACILERLHSWKFQPIAYELPITKKASFRPK
jgi:hypothetical protein